MSSENATNAAPVDGIVIWRVRTLSCDGGRIGRSWSEEFFTKEEDARERLADLVSESDERNPRYPFKAELETIDSTEGFCNWQFGTMLAVDSVNAR